MDRGNPHEGFDLGELSSIAIEAAERASTTLLTRFRPPVGAPLELKYKGPSARRVEISHHSRASMEPRLAKIYLDRGQCTYWHYWRIVPMIYEALWVMLVYRCLMTLEMWRMRVMDSTESNYRHRLGGQGRHYQSRRDQTLLRFA